MIPLPPRLPERGKFAALYRHINRLADCVHALAPMPTDKAKITANATGTAWHFDAGKKGTGRGGEATWL